MVSLFWIDVPGPGRMAVMPRPRPGSFGALKASGVDAVVSMLGEDEAIHLGLADEAEFCRLSGMSFHWLPIVDHGIPGAVETVQKLSAEIGGLLDREQAVVFHCYAGLGRSPLMAAAVLIDRGLLAADACELISRARGYAVPEMDEQHEWLQAYEGLRGRPR